MGKGGKKAMGIVQEFKDKFKPTFEVVPGPIFSREPLFVNHENDKKGVKTMAKHKKFQGVVNKDKVVVKVAPVAPVPVPVALDAGSKPDEVAARMAAADRLRGRKIETLQAYDNTPAITPQRPLVGDRHNIRITPAAKLR